MTTNLQRRETAPPPPAPDESYWAALLREGEFSETAQPDSDMVHERAAESGGSPERQDASTANGTYDDWCEMQRLMDEDSVIELAVSGFNRGGLLVEWRTLR